MAQQPGAESGSAAQLLLQQSSQSLSIALDVFPFQKKVSGSHLYAAYDQSVAPPAAAAASALAASPCPTAALSSSSTGAGGGSGAGGGRESLSYVAAAAALSLQGMDPRDHTFYHIVVASSADEGSGSGAGGDAATGALGGIALTYVPPPAMFRRDRFLSSINDEDDNETEDEDEEGKEQEAHAEDGEMDPAWGNEADWQREDEADGSLWLGRVAMAPYQEGDLRQL